MSAPAAAGRPLNSAQSGVWYAQRLHPDTPVFNLGGFVDIRGPLDAELLRTAIARASAEDDSLGLRFTEVDGAPVQTFGPVPATVPDLVDAGAEPDPAAAALAAMRADMETVTDLENGPLHHDLVFRLGPGHHRWYTRAHHLVRDGHTITLLCRRVSEHYRALLEDRAPAHPLGSFTRLLDAGDDYANTDTPARRRDAAYWSAHLDGAAMPPFPGGVPERRIAREVLQLDAAGFAALRGFAERAGVGWQQALLCAAVLHRHLWTGEADVLLSLAVPGRLIRNAAGMTANILPLRCAVDPAEPAVRLAARVAELGAKAQWHQRYRTEDLLRDLGWWERGVRQFGPVVNILTDAEEYPFGEATGTSHLMSTGGTADDLSLTVSRGEAGGLRVDVTLDTAYGADLAAYGRAFTRVVAALAARPDAPVGELDPLTPEERVRVVREWNATGDSASAEAALPELFEARVREHGGAVALVCGSERVSYARLNARANRLARHLVARGVGRGGLVGVLLERGVDFAVALLAVVKTGAGYVVLDPDFPDARLAAVAEGAAVSAVVSRSALSDRIPHVRPLVCVDEAVLAEQPPNDLGVAVDPGDVACVMFTSGSTGRPKGVMAPHRALVGSLVGQAYAPFGPDAVFLQCSPVSWDGFSLEFWGALLFGGRCVLQPGQRPEPGLIASLTAEHGVTMLQLSSGLFNVMADEYPAVFDRVKTVFTGGEVSSGAHVARVLGRGSGVVVANAYGPAESMGFSTVFEVPEGFGGGEISIGRPIVNKRVYLLDRRLRPVPVGAVGEVYLGGVGLAHGYLEAAGLSAGRFVADPFSEDGSRLYRTGDLARWRADGTLEFTGRGDDQVKVRGFRVEPAEIERALLDLDDVAQAAVIAAPDGGSLRLVGYAVPAGDAAPDGRELRHRLRGRLPEHLVPSAVVVLPRLPLTPNGKLDRRALPLPETAAAPGGRPPRDARDEILCGLFAEVLGVPEVSVDDDFFDLGGHSLLAARLAARARTALGAELTIRDVFQRPTVAALADGLRETAGSAPPPLTAVARPERLPLSYAQRRLWLVARMEGAFATYNVPLTVRLDGELDVAALRAAFCDLAVRHEPLRTVVEADEGEPYQRILDEPGIAFEHVRIAAPDLDAALSAAAGRPFDLAAEPPLRVTLFDLGDGAYLLLVLLHHIATDGESLQPLFGDLAAAYTARREGRAPDLPPLPVQYADYALWQRAALGDPADPESTAGRELAYWRETLAGLPEELGLALDRPRPLVAGTEGGAVPVALGADLGRRVMELAGAERATPFMVLQAALALTLTRMGAGEDVPIGSPVAGRSADGLAGLVGFFVNTLVLRTDTSGDPAFRELLARVRAADLDAFAHQELPFDLVIEALNPVRSLSRHPLFQVCLGLERAAGVAPDLPGAQAGPGTVAHSGTAKFDLEFLLSEDAEGVGGAVLYRTDIFDRATVERLVATFLRVLGQVTADPDLTVGEVDVLGAEGRTRMVEEWNATGDGSAAEATLPELLETRAREHRDAVALVCGAERLTYGELNGRANRLARHLVARGVGRGGLAGVLLERGIDFAVALLAVVKTGASYVVLDPDFPDTRLELVAAEARTAAVVTRASLAARLAGPAVLVDDPGVARFAADDLDVAVDPGDVACVMFTSGSTGRPKGVVAPHRALVGSLAGQVYAPFGPDAVFLQCSPVSWDGFSLEFWGALLFGGRCVLQPGQRPEPGLIASLTAEHGVTMLQLSSGLFNVMADEYPEAFDHVEIVFTGGEVASGAHVARVLGRGSGVAVANAYGPAESMGFSTVFEVPADLGAGAVPVGRPIGNKRVYLLDRRLRPVPVGAVGEVYLGGVGLAHGYLGAAGLSAGRFVADPFSEDGSRLYRTGDLARWRADGILEFTGRGDDQVKVRGFRVEPAEVERALLAHPRVAQAAVTAVSDGASLRLIGYVVPDGDADFDGRDVRDLTRRSVPEHLVPSAVVVLPRLPLTPNGKLDRRALPVPERAAAPGGRAPRDDRERTLCALFAEALGVTSTSIDDDFFDLGGHSLLAARLTARIRTATGAELTIRDIFQAPTVAALAQILPPADDPAPARRIRPALRRRTTSGTLL
ncbi:amino acid adenylation domain-containing protein [Actinocorallia aurantiaca]|uniref:Non-ribosomal peptide synthetase n=1 Tax=Actinocorallia aurantiaca TaxID=46204 RepID=A0ABN3UPV6_9ACTN